MPCVRPFADCLGPVVVPGACRGCGIHVAPVQSQLECGGDRRSCPRTSQAPGSSLRRALETRPMVDTQTVALPDATPSPAPRPLSRPKGIWALLWGFPGRRALQQGFFLKGHGQEGGGKGQGRTPGGLHSGLAL